MTAVEELRSHKVHAIRAVLIGWLALVATMWLISVLRYTLSVVANGGVDVAGYWIVLPTSYYTWTWKYRPYLTLGGNAVAEIVSGWIVGRFIAQRSGLMLMALTASVLLFQWSIGCCPPLRRWHS